MTIEIDEAVRNAASTGDVTALKELVAMHGPRLVRLHISFDDSFGNYTSRCICGWPTRSKGLPKDCVVSYTGCCTAFEDQEQCVQPSSRWPRLLNRQLLELAERVL